MSTTFYMKTNDTSPILELTLLDSSGTAINLTSATANIHVTDMNKTVLIDAAVTLQDASNGVVRYTFDGTLEAGNYLFEIEVTYADSSIETFPNVGYNELIIGVGLA